jgi:hypothetical protein
MVSQLTAGLLEHALPSGGRTSHSRSVEVVQLSDPRQS